MIDLKGKTRAELFAMEMWLGDILTAQGAQIERVRRAAAALRESEIKHPWLAAWLDGYALDLESSARLYKLGDIRLQIEVALKTMP